MQPEDEAYHAEIARGTFWGLIGSGIFKIISFLNIIYVARMVTQNDVGLFYLAISIVGLFGAWKTFGLPAALVRYIPYFESKRQGGKAKDLLRYTIIVNVISGIFLSIALWMVADAVGAIYNNPGLPEALRLIAIYVFLDNLFSTATSYLQSRSDIQACQTVSNAQALSKFGSNIVFFSVFGANLPSLCASFVLSYVLSLFVSVWLIAKKPHPISENGGSLTITELVRDIVPFGAMLTIIGIIWALISYADRVLLGYFAPPGQADALVAIYSLAVTLALNVMVFPGTVGNIFLPEISKLAGKNDLVGIRRAMATAQRWVLFITIPFAVVMIAFAKEMLSTFYGAEYSSGWIAMSFFCVGMAFSSFVLVISLALAGVRMVSLELKIAFVTFVVNILLCVMLIPSFGMNGAAAASMVSFAVYAILLIYYGWKVLKFRIPIEAYKLFAAGVITCALVFAFKPVFEIATAVLPVFAIPGIQPYISKVEYLLLLGVASSAAFVVFGTISLLAHCFEHEDIDVMRKAAKRIGMPQPLLSLAERIMILGVSKQKGE